MARSTREWIGRDDDEKVPDRVRVRVFGRDDGCCYCCGRKIMPGDDWQTDHIVALCNSGQHRESNLCTLLTEHHKNKTAADVAEKTDVARIRAKHLGLRKSKRPMVGSKASGWKKTFNNGWVRR